jgi:hypothetical protein
MFHHLILPQRTAYKFGHDQPMYHDIPVAICHHSVLVRAADGAVSVFVVFNADD